MACGETVVATMEIWKLFTKPVVYGCDFGYYGIICRIVYVRVIEKTKKGKERKGNVHAGQQINIDR